MNAVLPHQFRRNSDSMRRVSVPALGVVAYAPDDVQAVKALRFYSQKYPAQVVRIEPVHGFQFSPVEHSHGRSRGRARPPYPPGGRAHRPQRRERGVKNVDAKNYNRRTYYGAALKVNPAKAREARRMRRACGGAFGREDIKSKDLMHFGTSKIPRPEAVA